MERPWAFWRRVQYGTGMGVVLLALMWTGYNSFFYTAPTCFDGKQNSDERGVDCGGACTRTCAFDAIMPVVQWAQSFRVTEGQYNAVAYIENRNSVLGTDALGYTITLYDDTGTVITTRTGVTVLPPDGVYPIFEGNIAVGDRVPTRTFIEIDPVAFWLSADTSGMVSGRDQFEVRTRVLSGADGKPRLDTTIFNTSLEAAQNVEIITTIFNARGQALTASRSIVPSFAGREERSVVFTWPEPIAKTLRSCEVPSDVILAIDLSGSMNDDGGTPPQPISSVLTAAGAFIDRLRVNDQVGIITYATNAERVRGLDANHASALTTVQNLRITPAAEVGATNIGDAIRRAVDEFNSPRHSADARKVVVLLTDGLATAPGNDPETYARDAAATARDADISLFTIGLGSRVNEEFLAELAGEESHRYLAASRNDLDQIYRAISTAICEEGAAVIDVVPKVSANSSL